jgi:hypothetical protein
MLHVGSQCALTVGKRVLFVSDITCWLADSGRIWEHIGVDLATAQNELERQSPALLITVSRTAYTILCSTARNLAVHYTSGGVPQLATGEREW